jgi:hypothetical protein
VTVQEATDSSHPAVVLTTVSAPTEALRAFAASQMPLIVIGDEKTPPFELKGCQYYGIEDQLATGLLTARALPRNHYCRKNLGYLMAMQRGAASILESDDDNLPNGDFFLPRSRDVVCKRLNNADWVNAYQYFTDAPIWPRGFPLRLIRNTPPALASLAPAHLVSAPIQQGLVNGDPDVDAVYRLVHGGACDFAPAIQIALGRGSWCPFNSQNTAWWPEAYCMMYLPASCSFRMTDIWRSFVAQRIAWENGWNILFHSPNMRQIRNAHDLIRDFADEVPGYLHNERICERLAGLTLRPGPERIPENMLSCYATMIDLGVVAPEEMAMLKAWLADFRLSTRFRDPRSTYA